MLSMMTQLVVELYEFLGHTIVRRQDVRSGVTDFVVRTKEGEEWVARVFQGEVLENEIESLIQDYSTKRIDRYAMFSTTNFSQQQIQTAGNYPNIDLINQETLARYHSKAKANLMPDMRDQQIQRVSDSKESAGSKKRCPFCAELIQGAAIVCRYCGRNVSEGFSVPNSVSSNSRLASLEGLIQKYTARGYSVISQTDRLVTLEKEKKFNWFAFLLLFGVIYLIYFFVTPTKKATLRLMPDGTVKETGYTIAVKRSEESRGRLRYAALIFITLFLTFLCILYIVLVALQGSNIG